VCLPVAVETYGDTRMGISSSKKSFVAAAGSESVYSVSFNRQQTDSQQVPHF